MCVFLTLRLNKAQLKKQYDINGVDEDYFGPVFVQSAFSFAPWPVITSEKPDFGSMFKWGLIPHWVKDEETAYNIRKSTVNARVETVSEKPSFRRAVASGRCLVLSDGFYEYREVNRKRYPYFIQLREAEPFALAGIYDRWTNKVTGEVLSTFSILTTAANPLMERIHNRKKRMPVILNREMQMNWIKFNIGPDDIMTPFPADKMEAWTVSRDLSGRDRDKNNAEIIKPHDYPELQLLDGLGL